MPVHDLIIEFLEENGFPVNRWRHYRFWTNNQCVYSYNINPLGNLRIYDGGLITLGPLFEFSTRIENPDSLSIVLKHFKEMYVWLDKNINTGKGGSNHESQRLCSRNYQ